MSLRIHDWDEHQTYRRDRNQPPWIKVHRDLMRKPKWVKLSDAQRGQLLAMWIIAADENGSIPDDPELIRKLCYMDATPDLEVFISLGFIDRAVNVPSTCRQSDAPEAEAEAEAETEADIKTSGKTKQRDDVEKSEKRQRTRLPEYTESALLYEAGQVLGLGALNSADKRANRSILRHWLYKSNPIPSEEVYAAIHGLRLMVDQRRPEVEEWLKPGAPISLKALQNTHTLFDQGDGKAKRVLWDVAVEAYQRDDTPTHSTRGGGPKPLAITINEGVA